MLVDWERWDEHWGGMGPHLLEAGKICHHACCDRNEKKKKEMQVLGSCFHIPALHFPDGTRRVWLDVGTVGRSDFEANVVQEAELRVGGAEA